MDKLSFSYPNIKEDFRPKDPLEAAARFVFDRYGYDFYFDFEDPKMIQPIGERKYKIRVSVKRPILVKNYKTGEIKRFLLRIRNVLELDVYERGYKEYTVRGPGFPSVKSLIRRTIHEKIDKLYERLFLELESLKEKIAKPIFIQYQFNSIKNILQIVYQERQISPLQYQKKRNVLSLLQKAGYLNRDNGYLVATEKTNTLIDRFPRSRDFANYVMGDLILNYQEELDKRRFYIYKPYLKITVLYYKKAHLYSFNRKDLSEEEILRELKDSLISEYIYEYNVPKSIYKYYNLSTCIEHLVEYEILKEDEDNENLLFGYKNILKELIEHNPLGGVEDIRITAYI